MRATAADADRIAKVKSFLKPLRERASVRGKVEPLVVAEAERGPETFHAWLSEQPEKDRLRSISKCQRLKKGIASWPTGWLDKAGVVCFERGKGRVDKERGGKPGCRVQDC